MTNLTEQYRKGGLKDGTYYVKYSGNDIPSVDIYRRVYSLYDDSVVRFTLEQISEVLDEVPSYEEWQTAKKMIAQSIGVCDENAKLKETISNDIFLIKSRDSEIAKLKELLKRIRKELNDCPTCVEGSWKAKLVDDIDQVLGE